MFDFGFWELTIVMIVALLVVGPERLPALAGQAGKWIRKAKQMIESVRSDIESEIRAAELKDLLEKQQHEIGELKEILKDTRSEMEKGFEEDQDHGLIKAVEEQLVGDKNKIQRSANSESSPPKSGTQLE